MAPQDTVSSQNTQPANIHNLLCYIGNQASNPQTFVDKTNPKLCATPGLSVSLKAVGVILFMNLILVSSLKIILLKMFFFNLKQEFNLLIHAVFLVTL